MTFTPTTYAFKAATMTPTLQPTIDPSIHQNHVGDYKISAQTANHGNLLLCDASFIDLHILPHSFNLISYSFGSQAFGTDNKFALPNAEDRVIGINSDLNSLGEDAGNEETSLNQSSVPSQWHDPAYCSPNEVDGNKCIGHLSSYPFLAEQCYAGSGLLTTSPDECELKATDNASNGLRTESVGIDTAFDVMQPTEFVRNLFIYGD